MTLPRLPLFLLLLLVACSGGTGSDPSDDTGDDAIDSGGGVDVAQPDACSGAACDASDAEDVGRDSCVAYCDVAVECDPAQPSVGACRENCWDELEGADASCSSALMAYNECLGGLQSCSLYQQWLDGEPGYPCTDEEDAVDEACRGAANEAACDAWCTNDERCGNLDFPDGYESCMDYCIADLESTGSECALAAEALYFCYGEISCDDYLSAGTGEPDDPCLSEGIDLDEACGESEECAAICDELEGTLELCWSDREVRFLVAEDRTYRFDPARRVLAFRVVDGFDKLVEDLRASLGVRVSANPALSVIVIDDVNTAVWRQRVRSQEPSVIELRAYLGPDGRRVVDVEELVVRYDRSLVSPDEIRLEVDGSAHSDLLFDGGELLRVRLGAGSDSFEAAAKVLALPGVLYAEPNLARSYETRLAPDDPFYEQQWWLESDGPTAALPGTDIDAESAWELTRGNPAVIVAINDDGVDTGHPDLVDGLVPGLHEPESLGDDLDAGCCTHGTSVAGVAVGRGFNGIGISGVCPSCSLMPIWTNLELEVDSAIAETLAVAGGERRGCYQQQLWVRRTVTPRSSMRSTTPSHCRWHRWWSMRSSSRRTRGAMDWVLWSSSPRATATRTLPEIRSRPMKRPSSWRL